MFLVSKDKTTIIGVEQISALYISTDRRNIQVETMSGKSWNIGKYNTEHKAIQAMKLLAKRMNTEKEITVYVPEDAELQVV